MTALPEAVAAEAGVAPVRVTVMVPLPELAATAALATRISP